MADTALDLLQGTLDVLILRTLAWQPMHGYGISRWIRERSDGSIAPENAALYQALHRLERKGLVSSEWGISEKNHRAKYYSLTPQGRRQLQTEVAELKEYVTALFGVLDPT